MSEFKLDLNKFLLFGDSITQFSYNLKSYLLNPKLTEHEDYEFALGPALTFDYARKLDVVLRGFSGYTSRTARPILPLVLRDDHDKEPESRNIKLAYIFFGTNDATENGYASVPLDEYKENITFMIKELVSRDIKVVLVTPTYHNAKLWESFEDRYETSQGHRSTERNLKYVQVLKDLSKEFNVALLNLYDEFTNHSKILGVEPEELLVDGIHFNGKGYEAFYNGLTRVINDNYPELAASALDENLTDYKSANKDDYFTKINALY